MIAIMAGSTPAFAAEKTVHFNIFQGALGEALISIAAQSGRRIVFDPSIVEGRTVPGLQGAMPADAALRQVLQGSGLSARPDKSGNWIVVRDLAPDQISAGGKVLGTVRVAASTSENADVGANGSSDPIATEGTKSYTTNGAIVASKRALALKDTPAAVSVVTRQQLDDRVITGFNAGLDVLPGVTSTGGILTSRGYSITNIQIDGGSPLAIGTTQNFASRYTVLDDLSIYDSISMQRGSAGTFTGVGSASGSVSLERKRPLDHAALEATLQAGSWNNFRGIVDVSSPVLLDGLVKARGVFTAQSNDFFYDTAHRKFWQLYLNTEVQPAPSTRINIGGKISYQRSTPFFGLPANDKGQLLDLPRATCLCTPWSYSSTKTREIFAQLAQKIGQSWTFKVNSSFNWQNGNADAFNFGNTPGTIGVTPGGPNQGVLTVTRGPTTSNQQIIDSFIDGTFHVLGVKVDLTAGGNSQSITQRTVVPLKTFFLRNYTVVPFDPNAFPPIPAGATPGFTGRSFPRSSQRQLGIYGSLRISPADWLHLTISDRYSKFDLNLTSRAPSGSERYTAISYDNLTVPNLGLVVDLTKRFSAYANYNTIFDRANYVTAQGAYLPPMVGKNIEGGLKGTFAGGALNVAGSLFYIETNNTPVFDPSTFLPNNATTGASCCYRIDGSYQTSTGGELQAQGALTARLKIDASYTYTQLGQRPGPAASASSGFPAQRITPEHLIKIWTAWQPPVLDDALTIGGGLHAETSINPWSALSTFSNGAFTNAYIPTNRPGYVRGDLMVKYQIDDNVDLQVNLNNVTDTKYYAIVNNAGLNFYGEPRSVMFTLRGTL